MLTSQLRECKQMEGCVPKGGTVLAIAKFVSTWIFICERLEEPVHSEKEARASVLTSRTENAVANALALKNVEVRQERGNLHTNTEKAKNKRIGWALKVIEANKSARGKLVYYKS